ncbi:MAG: hypothetical protein HKN23_03275 [Verrucomicrobiales bacterium]|nr:hypothetical protein [Verrucomicrobiales bacterium]
MSRGLTFWDDETISFIRENFVAVAVPTWVRHEEGPEGDFLRKAGIDKMWITSSGYMTCVSASGEHLGRRPDAKVLAAFEALPESERAPGAIEVPEISASERLIPSPPEGGIVLRVHARFLHREENGSLRKAIHSDFPLMQEDPKRGERWRLFLEPNTEYLWLKEAEWRSLIPENPKPGQKIEANPQIGIRMARFHLTPRRATTSEGGIVPEKSIRIARLEVTVADVSETEISMDVSGRIEWGTEFDAELATTPNGPLKIGFATDLHGQLIYDREAGKITRFDIAAPGHVWGRWGDANGNSLPVERPGKAPFGFALELATGDSPTDRIPPGGNGRYVETRGYFGDRD